jgi:hypothetical protein
MYRSILSLSNRRCVVAAGLAALAMSSVACSDDAASPTSPAAREIAGPNNVTVGGDIPQLATFISLHIIDVTGKSVTEKATVKFRWSQPNDSVFVVDNSAKDLDPTIGVVKIAAPTAKGYQGCVRGTTAHFVADTAGVSYPTCNSKSWLSFDIPLGNVYMRRKPQLTVNMIDSWHNLLPGGALHVYNNTGWAVDVYDGQSPDEPAVNDGSITITLPAPHPFYIWKEIKAPTGHYVLNDVDAYTSPLVWEQKLVTQFYHKQVAY